MSTIGAVRPADPLIASSSTNKAQKDGPVFDMEAFKTTLEDRYRSWTKLPVEERIRDKYLDDHKLSESSLANLPPEERLLHEERIAKQTKQPMLKSYGSDDLDKAKNSMSLLSERTLTDIMTLKMREEEFAAREASDPSTPSPSLETAAGQPFIPGADLTKS